MSEITVIKNDQPPGPVMSIEQAIQRAELLKNYVKAVMVKGRDYGPIVERKQGERENNTLFQPGAERLCTLFGLVEDYEDAGSIIQPEVGFFSFSYKCILMRNARRELVDGRTVVMGDVVATAVGSANSREKKYRRGGKPCPECGAIAIKRSKFPPRDRPGDKPGWYCHDKSGGCGANFDADDPEILETKQVDNAAESFDLINTLQKMAAKRAKIAAVRAATNASDFFRLEEDVEDADERPAPSRQVKKAPQGDVENLKKWIAHNKCDMGRVLAEFDLTAIEEIPDAEFDRCMDLVKTKHRSVMPSARQESPTPAGDMMERELRATVERIETICAAKGKAVRHVAPNGLGKLSLEEATDLLKSLEQMPDAAR